MIYPKRLLAFMESKKKTTEPELEPDENVETTETPQPPELQQSSEDKIDDIIMQLHAEKALNCELAQANEQLKAQVEAKNAKIKELESAIKNARQETTPVDAPQPQSNETAESSEAADSPKNTPTEEVPMPSEAPRPQEASQPVGSAELEKQLAAFRDVLDTTVSKLVAENNALSLKLDDKTSRYQELVERVQEDRYRKDKVKILRRNINMRNLVSSVLDDYRCETPRMAGYDSQAALFLEQQLQKIIEKLDADLRQEMLVPLVNGLEGTDFDAEHQEIVERQPTDRPELDGKVYRSVAPGYVWTLPYIFKPRVNETGEEVYTYKFLLRSEDVITYKYVKPEERNDQ